MSQNTSGKNQKTDSLLVDKSDMNTKTIRRFFKILKEDPDLYQSYQANIAMAVQDEFAGYPAQYFNRMQIHRISNDAAKNFLNQLIKR